MDTHFTPITTLGHQPQQPHSPLITFCVPDAPVKCSVQCFPCSRTLRELSQGASSSGLLCSQPPGAVDLWFSLHSCLTLKSIRTRSKAVRYGHWFCGRSQLQLTAVSIPHRAPSGSAATAGRPGTHTPPSSVSLVKAGAAFLII